MRTFRGFNRWMTWYETFVGVNLTSPIPLLFDSTSSICTPWTLFSFYVDQYFGLVDFMSNWLNITLTWINLNYLIRLLIAQFALVMDQVKI